MASIYEPPQTGALTLETVEVYEQMVIVRWHSKDFVAPWPPVEVRGTDHPRYEEISLSDDVGTAYECAEGSANFTDGSRGTCWFTPGPPAHAATLSVATKRRSYELPL